MTIDVNEINLADHSFWRRPDRDEGFAILRRKRPVSWHEFPEGPEQGMQGFWSVTRYDDIVAVSQDAKTFRNSPTTYIGDQSVEEARQEGWFLNMDAPEHFKLRQVVSKIFSPTGVQTLARTAAQHAEGLVLAAKEKAACDFATEVAQPFPVAVICDILGAPASDRKHLHRLTVTALAGDAPEMGGADKVPAAFAELNVYGAELSRERRKNPKDDVVSLFIATEIDGRKFNDDEVGYFFQLLVTAGMETTGTVGGHMMRLFLENPDQMAIWAADPDAIAQTGVEELVRMVSPVQHMRRTAAANIEIGGQQIAEGDKVVVWYNSGNKDDARFENPFSFDVKRNPNPHIGFGGGGRHTCLGAHLARLELPMLAKASLQHLKNIEPAGDAVFVPSRFVNGLASLPIRYTA
ncbi:cytochrome P450 [Neorhizobium galegae]|uniref:Steroid C27-monooxygenase n=1 Tax=Neorhizobium galegae bv. officinalis TaxID=323656 RepID=A0A0T7H263_NEOGA|nr:cytochrome P450 [Neorhizobium galegae]CDZ53602.1 Steroid C27-monooxygenase [Neorhizobium galegae bv. officinalis]